MLSPPRSELPDPLRFNHGDAVRTAAQWRLRRQEIGDLMLPLAYGELPLAPASTRGILLHTALVRRLGGARLMSMRVEADGEHAFALRLFVPAGPEAFPVLIHGDGCWHYASDAVIAETLRRGYALAQFNRVELAADVAGAQAVQPLSRVFRGRPYAALAAWAWGYQRAVDVLLALEYIDRDRIAVVGHSRGGKAALLAGACDERIALTSANNSGAAGAGSFRWQGTGAETLADIVAAFPHWFGPQLPAFAGREHDLPFDQHFLKALVAPRALLTTEALADDWANPIGSWQTHRAARAVYQLLGAPDNIAIAFRSGGHDHGWQDWTTLLDFCDSVFHGRPRAEVLQDDPFPGLPVPASWYKP